MAEQEGPEVLYVKQVGKSFAVATESGLVLETGILTREAAEEAAAEFLRNPKYIPFVAAPAAEPQQVSAPASVPTPEVKTEHNPHGIDIHERFAALLRTLSRHGIKHGETASPAQNPSTAPDKFARTAPDGQNALPASEKKDAPKNITE